MSFLDKVRLIRKQIEGLSVYLDDTEALKTPEIFPIWEENVEYHIGDRRRYADILYKCLQDHTSRSDWIPATAVSLWARVLIPDPEVIPDWEQPESTNPYMIGDKVRHNNKIWISTIDYNVFEPGVYGWDEVV